MITRDGLARTLAVLIALAYLLLTPGIVFVAIMVLEGVPGALALLVVGSLYILGTAVLGFAYARRPFQNGFLLLAVLALLPVVITLTIGWSWLG